MNARHAVPLIAAALLSWGGVWWWNAHQPASPVVSHLETGWAQYRVGRLEGAEKEWLRAVELDPKNAEAWEVLGDYYLATGQPEPAQRAYAVVARLNPQTPHLWTKMARLAVGVGDGASGRRLVEEALKRDANDVEALNILSTLLARSNEPRPRVEILQRLAKLRPDDVTVLTKTADALSRFRRYDEAAPLVERILKLDPRASAAYAMRGAAAYDRDTSEASMRQAVADFQQAIALSPANWVARLYLGRCYLRLQQPQQALDQLKRVDAMAPADKTYLNDLANAYQRSGQVAQAATLRRRFAEAAREKHDVEELQQRLGSEPNNFQTNLRLGQLLLRRKNPSGAAELLDRALKLRPQDAAAQKAVRALDSAYAQSLSTGLKALGQRNKPQAMLHLARALQLRPRDARTQNAIQSFAAASGVSFSQALSALEHLSQD